jgi:2-methylcitrate dehydratase PrpD
VCGPIGAAVCAGRILGLSVDQMRSAIGLAASQSSGLLSYKDKPTHMAKSFQTGIASRNGVTAALFARQGYRAAPDVLTGRNDLLRPFGGSAVDSTRLVAELGTRYDICGTSLKRHASCIQTHAAVDALLQLLAEAKVTFNEIEGIDVQLAHQAVARVDANKLWTHNIQYVLALAAHQGRVAPEHFSAEWTTNREIANLTGDITVRGSDQLQERFPQQHGAIVSIRTRRGEFTRQCDEPHGSPQLPLSDDEVRDKFLHLAGSVLDAPAASSFWEALDTTDPAAPARPLLDALATRRRDSQ